MVDAVILPPTYKSPPTPTPPTTVKAPVALLVAAAALVIEIALVVAAPLPVTDCSVEVVQTLTVPVAVLTAVSVPADN